ncbi:MAG TPA: winged helix-turn-helix domain-containing protein [Nitrosopumilaceae archaeon]|nr:winged helix-turn-helix domain-containing protein [Nitrosopumilaceae archaeon]
MSLWKRGFLDIIVDILDCLIESPLKKTHITYKCNLDHRAIRKYLLLVERLGLVRRDYQDRAYYIITPKGLLYRNKFHAFTTMIKNDLENISSKKIIPSIPKTR